MPERRVPLEGDLGSLAIDLISITQALLVAECLSFRRAAKVLGTRQSAVSRRIRALEDMLGVSLFERHHAGVRVTTAGAQFFDRARGAVLQLDHAVKTAATAGRGAIGHLSIGILSAMAAGFLREIIRDYRARHPDVAMQILEGSSVKHIALVRTSRLDVAFVVGTPNVPHCDVAQLWSEQIFVALPQGHILCEYDEISWNTLRNEHFIVCQSDKGRVFHDQLIKSFADLGYSPSVESIDVSRETLMHLVALRLGLSLISQTAAATQIPEVVFRPIAGDPTVIRFSAVWLPSNDNPAFRRFLSLVRTMAKESRLVEFGTLHSTR